MDVQAFMCAFLLDDIDWPLWAFHFMDHGFLKAEV